MRKILALGLFVVAAEDGLTCRPFYPMGMAPMGYEHVGVCEG